MKTLDPFYIRSLGVAQAFETFTKDFTTSVQIFKKPLRILFLIRFVNSFDSISFRNLSISITGFSNVATAIAVPMVHLCAQLLVTRKPFDILWSI